MKAGCQNIFKMLIHFEYIYTHTYIYIYQRDCYTKGIEGYWYTDYIYIYIYIYIYMYIYIYTKN